MPEPLPEPSPVDVARRIRDALPPGGLFTDQHWRISPRIFPLGKKLVSELNSLGRVLLQFYRAANRLHRLSTRGDLPPWPHQWLDAGKPDWLLELQSADTFKNDLPRVIRPDLLLTETGLALTELDSVPGGIGLTAWLNAAYSDPTLTGSGAAHPIGGPRGMLDGFASIFGDAPSVRIMISKEASAYRPEMEWITNQLGRERFAVIDDATLAEPDGTAIYRFFELFDTDNVPASRELFRRAAARSLQLTPPPRPIFEEKLLLALLWNRNLRPFWRKELGEGFFNRLLGIVPYSWVIDPTPLPPQAALPRLELTGWDQLKTLSQRERNLILKPSGFSPNAWGARGVHLGSDLSAEDWSVAVDAAIAGFPTGPSILQEYHKPRIVDAEYVDFDAGTVRPMPARVRLCPYYFVSGDGDAARATLAGVLATLCPADKKIIHGMTDAILAPCGE